MNTTIINKDNNYSLQNLENYKKNIDNTTSEITEKYYLLLLEYFKFIVENIKPKNKAFTQFIISRGLDTITNVFNSIFYYTKNLDLTYFHCQKSFYFYVEFVGQISEDEKMFLQLTSRDATTYVYKKTIFEINNEYKQNIMEPNNDELAKIDYVTEHIFLFKSVISKMLNDNNFINNKNTTISISKLNNINNKIIQSKIDVKNITILHLFFDNLLLNNDDFNKFYEIINAFFKKLNKKQSINLLQIKNKLIHEDFSDVLADESNEKFISWVFAV